MQALRLHLDIPRAVLTKAAARLSTEAYWGPLAPLRLEEIAAPSLRGPRWVRIATALCGICASDMHAVMLEGGLDSPLSSFVSFPMVPGHEIIGTVVEVGREVERVRVGDRVIVNPILSCTPRGIDPVCPQCSEGEFGLCHNFARGDLPPALLISTCGCLNGGFAPEVVVHEAQCIGVPEDVAAEAAVLADPIAVTLRAVLRNPPEPGDTCLVIGCGILGLGGILCLRALYPGVRVIAVAKHSFQQDAARRCGAHAVVSPVPEERFFEDVAALTGGTLYRSAMMRPLLGFLSRVVPAAGDALERKYLGRPLLVGGVQRVYDCIGSAATIEIGIRVTECGGRVVMIGVASPKRFEWSPVWFREVALTGSFGVGTESFDGGRRHTYEIYLDLVRSGRLKVEGLLTHRFPLDAYAEAFRVCTGRGQSHAVKAAFDFGSR